MKRSKRLEQAIADWKIGAHHSGLMKLGWEYKKDGAELQEAIADAQAVYASIEDPHKHESHMREIVDAFEKVWETEYAASRPAKPKADGGNVEALRRNQEEWLALQNADTGILKAIRAQDASETRIRTKDAVAALYRNATGRIRHGKSIESIRWADASDGYAGICRAGADASIYMSTTTFGNLIDEEKQKELDDMHRPETPTAYSAKDDNIVGKALLLMEYDEPIGGEKMDKEAFRYLPRKDKDEYRRQVLEHTCIVLERAGLRPTAVVFSGNRSYHCLFRLSEQISRQAWDACEERLKSAYRRLGADEHVLSYNRMTRIPRGCTQAVAQDGEAQRVAYLDPDAEITLEAYTEALEMVADEIQAKCESGTITVAMEKKPDPKTGRDKWDFVPSKWEKSLADVGIVPKYARSSSDGRYELVLRHDGGLYHVICAQGALDHIIKMYKGVDYMAAMMLREKRASKLTSEKYEQYAGLAEPYNDPKDTRQTVLIPYRNGMLEISRRDTTFHDGDYMGYDIADDLPTLRRDWRFTFEGSEMQDFIECACGREEGDPDWIARRNAIISLIGYEICAKKEAMNYLPVIVEKSLEENNGGTGKSLITKSLSFIRKTCFLDFKTWEDDQRFFFEDMATRRPRVARCEDLPKGFDLEKMFNRLAENFKADLKGKPSITLDMETMPKFIATSNHYLKGTGNSFMRRYKEFEITDWWRGKDPARHYGHLLYYDWTEEEWQRFDSFMASCAGYYMRHGLIEYRGVNSAEKALDVNLGDLRDFFDEKTEGLPWTTQPMELVGDYEDWYKHSHAGKYQKVSYNSKTLKDKLKQYCNIMGLSYFDNDGRPWQHNGESKRWIVVEAKASAASASQTAATPPAASSVVQTPPETNHDDLTKSMTKSTTKSVSNAVTSDENCDFFRDAPDYPENPDKNASGESDFVRILSGHNTVENQHIACCPDRPDTFFLDQYARKNLKKICTGSGLFASAPSACQRREKGDGFDGDIDGVGYFLSGCEGNRVLHFCGLRPKPSRVPLAGDIYDIGYVVCGVYGEGIETVIRTDKDGNSAKAGWTVEDDG